MASPAMYGPPPRRHSVVGPLILIVMGSLILLRNFGYTIPLLHNFVRYWPLLLVVIGTGAAGGVFCSAQRPASGAGDGRRARCFY